MLTFLYTLFPPLFPMLYTPYPSSCRSWGRGFQPCGSGGCYDECHYLEFFTGKNMIFLLVVSSSSLYDIPEGIFVCLLTYFYALFFLHRFEMP